MAGGRWTAQNKRRPGAYVNFKSVPRALASIGTRGTITVPMLSMEWGPEGQLIELNSSDLIDGKSIEKIGFSGFDAEALPFRAMLSHCQKALIFRMDNTGTVKASAEVNDGGLTATAKYSGEAGNNIHVAVIKSDQDDDLFDVITFYRLVEMDRQTVETIDELVSNSWVDFSGDGALVVTEEAGVPLKGGKSGTPGTGDLGTNYIQALRGKQWDVMAFGWVFSNFGPAMEQYIRFNREDIGIARQLVINGDTSADYEGIISTMNQGFVDSNGERCDPETFTLYVGSLTAGAEITDSRTGFVIPGATEIINPVDETEFDLFLDEGYFLLSRRRDGAIVVEQDINTLHTFTQDKNREFSKNRVLRTLDEINNTITLTFERSYLGKVNNNDTGRTSFKADCIHYLNSLQENGAIQNFDPTQDIVVSQGNDVDSVVVDLGIQPVDSMEKLYMTVNVG